LGDTRDRSYIKSAYIAIMKIHNPKTQTLIVLIVINRS